ncbi:MAG: hypothetical protein WBR17_28530 [Paraburkholderia sp.]|uniref:hypothetical protein n=1 Tax=Paraburkholderia sp. TaxID=1926495 RepID=UPI003C40F85E
MASTVRKTLGLIAGEGAAAFSERLAAKGVGVAEEAAEAASGEHLPGNRPVPRDDSAAIPPAPSVPTRNAGTPGIQGERSQGTTTPQGFVVDPAVAEASQRINGTRAGLPDDYAVQPAPAALKPASGQQGVLVDNDGRRYITRDGKTYPARFDKDNGTWRVWQDANPYRPQYPIRLDDQGNWQVHNDVGLKGGMDPAGAGPSGLQQSQSFDRAYQVSTSTGTPPSTEMLQTLNPPAWKSEADRLVNDTEFIQKYRAEFDRLRPEQKQALRNWTYVDLGETYSTGSDHDDVNFELNQQLHYYLHDSDTAIRTQALQTALTSLPRPDGESRLIRIAEIPGDYAGKFAPGDYVTNSPAFMSAASDSGFAQAYLAYSSHEAEPREAFALYDIQSKSGTPFINRITTLAPGEHEWLFRPNTVFRVEEIATATSRDGTTSPRIGVRLTEVPITTPIFAKNIHTGAQELVYPPGTTPTYTPLQPTRSPSLQIPPRPDPGTLPPPTHGDPNQPGPSNA